MPRANPLLDDREVQFLLDEVLDLDALLALPAFSDHDRDTFELYLSSSRRLARELLYPAYRPMDQEAPSLDGGAVSVHPRMLDIFRELTQLGVLTATRPAEVGGQQLPSTVATLAHMYLMAANLGAYAYLGLTTGAARLIESFGNDDLKARFMKRMYAGEWTGTMALTEPQAGSSLSDVTTRAQMTDAGHYLLRGSKIFISGGDHDLAENIVHLTLARIEGAPAGIKGVSLFAIPKLRDEGGKLVPNDVATAGLFHKIGWRGLPSLAIELGENGDCHGWLVGEPNRGINAMFQMMNEARLMVGANATATASVAYQESLAYALERPQGRPFGAKDPSSPQVPIIQHADVRRMLLRQKAIVEGGFALVAKAAYWMDLSEHATDDGVRRRTAMLLDLVIPVAKSFPAEKGFEANSLAIQIHGGYGYTSEYLPEAWWRDQKLNSIHEGTTGIHGFDLLGRKAMAGGGAAIAYWVEEVQSTLQKARACGVEPSWCEALDAAVREVVAVTQALGARGLEGDLEGMLLHSSDYLDLFSTVTVAWLWIEAAAVAQRGLGKGGASEPFYRGKLQAAQYWTRTELPRASQLAELCRGGEDSYARMRPEWF